MRTRFSHDSALLKVDLNYSKAKDISLPGFFLSSRSLPISELKRRGKKKIRTMIPVIQLKQTASLFLVVLLLVGFAIVQSAHAVIPQPDGGDATGNTTEESNAPSENTAMKPAANHPPNHPVIPIIFTRFVPVPCAGEKVRLRGELRLHFKNTDGVAKPESANLAGFSGTGESTGRRYAANNSVNDDDVELTRRNEKGLGKWTIRFHVFGNPNPPLKGDPNPGKVFRFILEYTVMFEFRNGKVTDLNAKPEVVCKR
jgi:hypothetical protein